ncbi:hypothetical protein GW17_00029974 [Ensete ventricosum]|nr:hypothetical protein GW17_00029974 [Ensete ventricosum]
MRMVVSKGVLMSCVGGGGGLCLTEPLAEAALPFDAQVSQAGADGGRGGGESSFLLSNDSKSTTAALLSLPFRSTDRPSRSSISSAKVNRHQTFIAVDNTTVSLTSGQDMRPSQDLDLAGA